MTEVTTTGDNAHLHDSGRMVGNPEINPVGIRTGSVTIRRFVERDWPIRDVYLQRFAITALPRQ